MTEETPTVNRNSWDTASRTAPLRVPTLTRMSARRDRWILSANALSLSRVPLAALLWLAPHEPAWVLSIVVVAGITDVLDGWVARRGKARAWNDGDRGALAATVARGAAIDGFADKVFVVSTVAALLVTVQPPFWVVGALVSRELLIVPLIVAYRVAPPSLRERVDFTAGTIGKAATLAQFTAIVLGFLRHPTFVHVAVVAGLLGATSVVYYVGRVFVRGRPIAREP